jgi:uncharacterized glyoxalase superfamily protein PhnB
MEDATFKPAGYTSVSPYLIVDDASALIEFLAAVFDAEELRRFPDESGRIMHAEMRVGDTVVMLADSVEDWPASQAQIHVYVTDVDETYRRALEAGATTVQEPVQKEDEDKRGGVVGPGNITWWIATRVG